MGLESYKKRGTYFRPYLESKMRQVPSTELYYLNFSVGTQKKKRKNYFHFNLQFANIPRTTIEERNRISF